MSEADDSLILGLDSSGPYCAAALLRGSAVLAERTDPMPRGQADALLPMIGDMLASAGLDWSALHAIAVGTGPGNFTGIRISVAAARGLAMGLGVPAIGVTMFDALALGQEVPVQVAIGAPRGQVCLRAPGQSPVVIGDPDRISPDNGPVIPWPDADVLGPTAGRLRVIGPTQSLPVAIAQVAADRLGSDHPAPAPFYLRAADAAPPRDAPPRILP